MNISAAIRLSALFLLAAVAVVAAAPDFNGIWKLDLARSQLPGHPTFGPSALDQVLTLKLDDTALSVSTQTTSAPTGKVTTNETYLLDGKPHDFTPVTRAGGAPAKGIRTATRTDDPSAILVLEAVTRGTGDDAITVHNTHTWTVSADGQSLTVTTTVRGSQGEVSTTRVFGLVPAAPSP
jgi:hypothetical protein